MRKINKTGCFSVTAGLGLGAALVGAAVFLSSIATQPQFPPPTSTALPTRTSTPTHTGTVTPSRTPTPTLTATPRGAFMPATAMVFGGAHQVGPLWLRVTRVQNTSEVPITDSEAVIPPDHHQYLWVEVTIECYSEETGYCIFNYDDFGLRTSEGIEYHPLVPTYYDMENMFEVLTISHGAYLTGRLLFIIPTIDSTMYLYYPETMEWDEQKIFEIQ